MGALGAVDALELALSVVVALEGLGLLCRSHAMTNDVSLVIAADNELVAADIADISHARRICLDVAGCSRSAGRHDLPVMRFSMTSFGTREPEHSRSLRSRRVPGLRDVRGKQSRMKPFAVALCDAFLEQADDELVRYELAGVHVLLSRH